MSEIDGKKITLSSLLGNEYFFNVPDYQRPYSWQRDNCYQLFDDIYDSDRTSDYFLGTIILQEIGKIGTSNRYDIIDGQQRLTTIQILLACLRDKVSDSGYKNSIQDKICQKENPVDGLPQIMRLDVRESNIFKKHVQDFEGTQKTGSFSPENDAQRNILTAINVFNEKIGELSQSEIEKFIQHISQKCIFICVSTKDFDDAYRLFTIINDRGLQLRRIDILKTSNLEPKIISDDKDRKLYSHIWESMENDLGSDDFENLISFIRTIEVKEKPKEDILKEYNKLIFDTGKIKRGKDFIVYVQSYRFIYEKLIYEKDVDLGTNTVSFKNLLQLMIDFLPSNEWIPALLLYYKKFNTDKLFEFLQKLENKFVADWIIALTPTKRTVNLNAILKDIEASGKCENVLSSANLDFDKAALTNELNQDTYGKRHAKYVLLKLEYLESEQNIERKYSTISVEHVLPQNPDSSSNWVKIFDEELRNNFTNKLSNLILLSHKKNSSASNLDFEDKKSKYINGRITDLARSQKVITYKQWTPDVLKNRQEDIIKLLCK